MRRMQSLTYSLNIAVADTFGNYTVSDTSLESLPFPEPLRAVLGEYDARSDDFDEANLGFVLEATLNKCGEVSILQRKACVAEVAAFEFSDKRGKEKNPWGTRFGPLIAGTLEDGTAYFFPDIAQVDDTVIQYWSQRSQEARHPILKARYADVAWDLAKAATCRRPAVEMAWQAIDAYVECGRRFSSTGMTKGRLERALELALLVGDVIRVRQVVDTMLQLLDDASHPGFYVTWLFDVLYDRKNVDLVEQQQKRLIDSLETELYRICGSPNPVGVVAREPAVRLAKHYQRIGQLNEAQRVIRAYGDAVASFANKAEGLVAMHWFQEAYAIYLQFGLKEEAEPFQVAAKEKAGEAKMVQVSHSFEVPNEEMERFLEEVTEGDLESTLKRIAINFCPRLDEIRKQLAEMPVDARLLSMIPHAKMNENHVVARAGSIENDPEGRLVFQVADNLKFSAGLLQMAIDRTREKYDFSAKTILPFLFKSPLFSTDRGPLLGHAITAYMAGDHVTAIHVLVPQIEHALRRLLGMLGKPTDKHRRSDLRVMVEKTLNDILENEQATQDCLGEDMMTYLRVFLCDPRGFNVRNILAHGLMKPQQFNRFVSDRLLHIIFVLAHIRASEEPQSDEGTKRSA